MNKSIGTVCVYCSCGNLAVPGLQVSFINSQGVVVQERRTDCNGCAVFSVLQQGFYQICVLPDLHHLPCCRDCCTLFVTPCQTRCCHFSFRYCCDQPTGSLTIHTKDANYPAYMLDEGEITLWRGLK